MVNFNTHVCKGKILASRLCSLFENVHITWLCCALRGTRVTGNEWTLRGKGGVMARLVASSVVLSFKTRGSRSGWNWHQPRSLSELARGVHHRATTTRITLLPPTTHTLLKHIERPFWHFLHLSFKVFFETEINKNRNNLKKLKIHWTSKIEKEKNERKEKLGIGERVICWQLVWQER